MSKDTKDKLIEVAIKLFAENGFHGTSVKDICSEAKANIASVNYHFGSKEELYRAVMENLMTTRKHPPEPVGDEDPMFFLYDFSIALLKAIGRGDDPFMRILAIEQVYPTGMLADTFRKHILERHNKTVGFLCDKFTISEERAHLVVFSLIGSLVHFIKGRDFVSIIMPEIYDTEGRITDDGMDKIAKHVVMSTIASIRAGELK